MLQIPLPTFPPVPEVSQSPSWSQCHRTCWAQGQHGSVSSQKRDDFTFFHTLSVLSPSRKQHRNTLNEMPGSIYSSYIQLTTATVPQSWAMKQEVQKLLFLTKHLWRWLCFFSISHPCVCSLEAGRKGKAALSWHQLDTSKEPPGLATVIG